jgi:hypothetical protein
MVRITSPPNLTYNLKKYLGIFSIYESLIALTLTATSPLSSTLSLLEDKVEVAVTIATGLSEQYSQKLKPKKVD